MRLQVGAQKTQAENQVSGRLFVRLDRAQWRRLLDFAAGVAFVVFLVYIGIEAYLAYGVDFRGYYAAARVVLNGGDPYDYGQVSQILLDVTGEMGNNPYYYPPWFCLLVVPLALLPFELSSMIWIALTLGVYWLGRGSLSICWVGSSQGGGGGLFCSAARTSLCGSRCAPGS